jgi:hypothetical protein
MSMIDFLILAVAFILESDSFFYSRNPGFLEECSKFVGTRK